MIRTATTKSRANTVPKLSKNAISDIALVILFLHPHRFSWLSSFTSHVGRAGNNHFPPLISLIYHKPLMFPQTLQPRPLLGEISRCCAAKKGSSHGNNNPLCVFTGEEASLEAHVAYLDPRPFCSCPITTSVLLMQLLGGWFREAPAVPTASPAYYYHVPSLSKLGTRWIWVQAG